MLRALINDLDSLNYTYTDSRLEQLISVAAKYVNQDIESSYIINVISPDIAPNPVDSNDDIFINLTVMKSACLVDQGAFRTKAALAGLSVKCGPASIQTLQQLDGFRELINNGPCAAYSALLKDYKMGSGVVCHGILSPFVNDNFDQQTLFSYYDNNNRLVR